MAISQNQRIVDLLYAGQGKDAVRDLLGVSEAAVQAAVQDLNLLPSNPVVTPDVSTGTLETSGLATLASALVTGEAEVGSLEVVGNVGFYGTEPVAKQTITGALSTVADAPAKAVLTSIISALSTPGQATNGTT